MLIPKKQNNDLKYPETFFDISHLKINSIIPFKPTNNRFFIFYYCL